MTTPDDEKALRSSAAAHEAGHAIVAWELGVEIASLVIGCDGSGESLIGCATHLSIIDQLAICAAGMEAVRLMEADAHCQAGWSDQGKIIALLEDHPEADHVRLRDEGHRRASEILRANQRSLEHIATKLASTGAIDGRSFQTEVEMVTGCRATAQSLGRKCGEPWK